MKQRGFHDFSGVGIIMIVMIIGAVTGAAIPISCYGFGRSSSR